MFREFRFRDAARAAGGWDLDLRSRGSMQRLPCSFVIDATGRRAVFATRQGARRIFDDSMVGLCCFFSRAADSARDTRLLLEPVRDGWWYSAVLPAGRALAVFMTDGDIAKQLELADGQRFHSALANTILMRRRFEAAKIESAPRLLPAGSGCLSDVRGDRWVAVGDAACTLDPLSGQGLFKAMTNGICAAYAVADGLSGDDRGLERYGRDIARAYLQYLDTRDEYYDAERRWPNARFWKRRQHKVTLDPMARVVLTRQPAKPSFGVQGHLLSALGGTPQTAHEIVTRVKKRDPTGASDRRVVLTLQHLIRSGAVAEQ